MALVAYALVRVGTHGLLGLLLWVDAQPGVLELIRRRQSAAGVAPAEETC